MARLVSFVHVQDERGKFVAFGPDDEVPDWAAKQMGPHCFEGGEHPLSGETTAPPKAGPGSGRDAWVEYAARHDVEVDDDATRDAIIEACADAGLPVN